eukprot:TRINITY_DN65982_c6_g1_i1.p1 TRINITY_DN65982_c6_g1~~TRINITY_DN65982_c6_g1_i1.p1  ORF type:complete len:1168 (+),score=769.25 TRINITY_DN65982_c6_g1_i1:141-3506(+)
MSNNAKSDAAADDSGSKPSAKRDAMLEIQAEVQRAWAEAKIWETDPPTEEEAKDEQGKFFCTFPYPYMNGVLHLGHAFSLSKAEFAARYNRLKGKRVLFPFGFHCTGMPIAACADKLKREIATYGNPPVFPKEKDENEEEEEEKKKSEAAGGEAKPTEDNGGKKKGKGGKKKKKGKAAKKKSKHKFQWQIMEEMGVPASEIAKFQDANYWLGYFPPIAKDDLAEFGLAADFRRSFITTEVNPYYDAFIRWHFNTLKKKDKIAFGKRLSVFSPKDDQPCADHDRASGEGVGPQEYTIIKLELQKPYPASLAQFEDTDKKIFLAAATLRPETMYGQTNCWVLPTGKYGVFQMNDENELFVCSDRSALNMSYQDLMPTRGKPDKLGSVDGAALIGCALKAPLAQFDKVYVLPLLTIKMNKGTGVVTSVPSDAPDDYAALMDMKNKEKLREKFGVKDEMVLPFDIVPIIDIPGLGTNAAAKLCTERKVKSQNDTAKLAEIKEIVYKEGFYKGKMIVGPHAGMRVEEAKPVIRAEMIKAGQAVSYSEPESVVMSRSGDECVVALTEQWYLKYGEDEWRARVDKHVAETLETYNPVALSKYKYTVSWLREWACSRSYGLGTFVPWDRQFVIESLSDSTIYMSYYTIAHFLQGGVLDGSQTGPAGIKPEQLTDAVFDYVLRTGADRGEYPADCGIPRETLDRMNAEFAYWYPMDLRVSGKDLIGNHLTMSLYNHAAVWDSQPDMWPRSFYTNGHVKLNNDKMSKSTGNFLTLNQSVKKYSADATRFALADAGDGLEDANFSEESANAAILRLWKEKENIAELIEMRDQLRDDGGDDEKMTFMDRVFANAMNACIAEADGFFAGMQFHEALRVGFFEFINARDLYRAAAESMNRRLIDRYIEAFVVMLSPIAPHIAQHIWQSVMKRDGFVANAPFPQPTAPEDKLLTQQITYLRQQAHRMNAFVAKKKNSKGKKSKKGKQSEEAEKEAPLNAVYIYVASEWPEPESSILKWIAESYEADPNNVISVKDIAKRLGKSGLAKTKREKGNAMSFSAGVLRDLQVRGKDALNVKMPFDEVALLREHTHVATQGLTGLTTIKIFDAADPDIVDPNNRAGVARPGQPEPYFFHAE